MKRLGPDLKMPDLKSLKGLKVPEPLANVYYDLRDRRLLPLVALVVVAIAAVPFLLGGDAEEPPPPLALGADAVEEAEGAAAATLNVVEAKPGLRDYRKRLRGNSPTDPFKQRYTSLPPSAQLRVTTSGSGGDGGLVTEVEESVVEVDEPGSPGAQAPRGVSGGTGTGGGSKGRFKPGVLYGHRPDVRFGKAGSGELTLHRELPVGRFLPKANPVVLFLGVTQNGKRALFNVNPEVTLVKGNGDCVGGVRNCQILSMRAGRAVTLLTGSPNRAFRLKVVEINLVEVDLPAKQPEGAEGSRSGNQPRAAWAHGLSAGGQLGGAPNRP